MLRSAGRQARAVATLGVVAALALAGVAVAQGGTGSSGNSGKGTARQGHAGRHAGPPPLGAGMKGLTYGEFHVQDKEGNAQVIRLDEGKITAVDSSSITLEENDGSEVTIALDGDTKVLGRPGSKSTANDLEAGQTVAVCGPKDGAAKTVMPAPQKGQRKGMGQGQGRSGQQGPPPGAPGPQGQQGPQGNGGPQGQAGPQGPPSSS
jgi:hypothetical protein